MPQPKTPTPEIHSLTKFLTESLGAVTKALPKDAIDEVWAHKKYSEASRTPNVQNELLCIAGPQLFLVGKGAVDQLSEPPVVMLWLWQNRLHLTWTLSVFNWDRPNIWRAAIPHDSKAWSLLRSGPTRIVLLNDRTCVGALEVDIPAVDPIIWGRFDRIDPGYQTLRDELGGKMIAFAYIHEPTTPKKQLRKGWATKMDEFANSVFGFLGDPGNAETLRTETSKLGHSAFAKEDFVADYYQYCLYHFLQQDENPCQHLVALGKELANYPMHHEGATSALRLALFSANATNGGLMVPSLNPNGKTSLVELDTDKLGDRCSSFWKRLSLQPTMYYQEVVGAGSCPVEPSAFLQNIPLYQGDIEAGETFVSTLLAEAISLKQWTIPYGAYVLLNAGEMEAVKLHEIGDEVASVIVDRRGDYLLVWTNPRQKLVSAVSSS